MYRDLHVKCLLLLASVVPEIFIVLQFFIIISSIKDFEDPFSIIDKHQHMHFFTFNTVLV